MATLTPAMIASNMAGSSGLVVGNMALKPPKSKKKKHKSRSKSNLNPNPHSSDEIGHGHHHRHSSRHQHYHYHFPHGNTSLQPPISYPVPQYPPVTPGPPSPYKDIPRTPGEANTTYLPLPAYFPSYGGTYVQSQGQYLSHPQPPYQIPAQMPTPNPPLQPSPEAGPSTAQNLDRAFGRGRKRALCIGINYVGQERMLRGCVNDARRVRRFLIDYHDFPMDSIVLLTDSESGSHGMPTRRNILKAMRWLVKDARRGDSLFFHFSGHGGQVPDLDGDEDDGLDEIIYPIDYERKGYILDDDMHAIMVKHLPDGCRFTALFDSCHSGTALDLPYIYSSRGRLKCGRLTKQGASRKAGADAVSWSACEDGQTSKDTFSLDGSAVGAMSHAFISVLMENQRLTYKELLKYLRNQLQSKHNQKPQLSTSHRIDTNDIFTI